MANIFNQLKISRPRRNAFNLSHENKLSTDFGVLTPIFCQELVPGDVFKNRSEVFIRFAPLLAPVMHRINVYTHFWFVPNRLVMPDWQEFITRKDEGEHNLPIFDIGAATHIPDESHMIERFLLQDGSLADYLGLPTYPRDSSPGTRYPKLDVHILPFLAYQLIYNENYRDQNLEEEVDINYKEWTKEGVDWKKKVKEVMRLRSRAWEKDYFTSALPWAQKGDAVKIPGTDGGSISGRAPIIYDPPADGPFGYGDGHTLIRARGAVDVTGTNRPDLSMGARTVGFDPFNSDVVSAIKGASPSDPSNPASQNTMSVLGAQESVSTPVPGIDARLGVTMRTQGDPTSDTVGIGVADIDPNGNLWADLDNIEQRIDSGDVATGNTINDLRTAFQLQRWMERMARAGSRYVEQILSTFGIRVPDWRLQRPEFIGGGKNPVVVSEVLQTSETTPEGALGTMGGHAISAGMNNAFRYKAQEHGYIIGIMSIMPRTAYQQGVPRHFLRNSWDDFYWPDFAHLGEQPIFNQELYHQYEAENEEVNKETFGYQMRYAEYKYIPSTVHGDFRNSLYFWHLGRIFDSLPKLNKDFVTVKDVEAESTGVIDESLHRIFAVEDYPNPLWCQIYNKCSALRPMPRFSTPGYADH